MGKSDSFVNALRKLRNAVQMDMDPSERECRMAETFAALDDWLTRGGDLPDDWKPHPSQEISRRSG